MELIAQYPITETVITPHIGRPVAAVLANGDVCCGIIDRVHDGHLFMRPIEVPQATVANLQKKIKAHPSVKHATNRMEKVQTKAFGWGWGFPWIWPLLGLTALFALPFFWW